MATVVLSASCCLGAAETAQRLEPEPAILAERAAERAPTKGEGASAPRRRAVDCARRLKRRERVVVVGAGFGGLSAAKGLAKAPVDVVVIDRRNYHLFQPLLYQVATAGLSPADIASPIRSILSRQMNATVILADVTAINPVRKVVTAEDREIAYDRLVIATGATHSYFSHEEWASHAPGLKTIDDATLIRRRILLAFEKAEVEDDPIEREQLLSFVIIGGGPTGVEMAGAIAELARKALSADFRSIDPRSTRVTLIEAGPRTLARVSSRPVGSGAPIAGEAQRRSAPWQGGDALR